MDRKLRKARLEAINEINKWLVPFGLTAECYIEDMPQEQLGYYEMGSVFEKEILVYINPENISRTCKEDSIHDRYSEPSTQVKITIYHEIGHGILEQIIDWMENVKEIQTLCDGPFGETYKDVINDDVEEETIVEDFAWGFFDGIPSSLQKCFEQMNQNI